MCRAVRAGLVVVRGLRERGRGEAMVQARVPAFSRAGGGPVPVCVPARNAEEGQDLERHLSERDGAKTLGAAAHKAKLGANLE